MTVQTRDILRRCVFKPYRKGYGPTFRLTTWDTGRTWRNEGSKSLLGYRLTMHEQGKRTTLFEGEDFGCSPLHAIDSDEAVAGIMGFLTLRPGDTDRDYFADYTEEQMAYCLEHGEALACAVSGRFGDR